MAALADESDVVTELGGSITAAQSARVPSLLIKASAAFRREAGRRQFTNDTYTQRLQVVDGRVRLPEPPVESVTSVVDDSGNTVVYTQVGDWLKVSGHHHNYDNSFGCYRPPGLGSGWFVTAAYAGGAVPDEVRVTVAQIVARALKTNPVAATGVKSQDSTMGPFSGRTEFFDWAAEVITLTDEECALAASFIYPGTNPIVYQAGFSHQPHIWPDQI